MMPPKKSKVHRPDESVSVSDDKVMHDEAKPHNFLDTKLLDGKRKRVKPFLQSNALEWYYNICSTNVHI